ncbi:MAG: hypothetical protein ACM3XO_17805 [Bacteroidota bacterium]
MDWKYVEDGELPPTKPGSMQICLVSARREDQRYIACASYLGGAWMDIDLEPIDVYAWCILEPAEERS